MKGWQIITASAVLVILLIACAPRMAPVSAPEKSSPTSPAITPGAVESAPVKEPWEVKWDKVVQGAKQEGRVVVYGAATGEIRDALMRAFSGRYRIPVEYLAAKGPELAEKILMERNARLYNVDVLIGASSPAINTLKPLGVFDPLEPVLILPEVTKPELWWENQLPWVDKEHCFIGFLAYTSPNIVVNGDNVKPGEIKSYRDLLAPKWKGKIAMHDPSIAGHGQNTVHVVGYYLMGLDYLRQLASQELFISRDHRLLAEWVARGKYPIGIAVEPEPIEQMRAAGANLQFNPVNEGSYVRMGTGFLALPKNVPHPNASTLFINWLLSKEGQTTYTNVARIQSAREDIPTTNLEPLSLRQPGVKYLNTNNEEFWLRGPEILKLGKEIFGR